MNDFPALSDDFIGRIYRGLDIPTAGLIQSMALELLRRRNLPTEFFASKEDGVLNVP